MDVTGLAHISRAPSSLIGIIIPIYRVRNETQKS